MHQITVASRALAGGKLNVRDHPALRQAINALEEDHEFLLAGEVFDKDQLDGYMELKWEEVYTFEHAPHPVEFKMYYSA